MCIGLDRTTAGTHSRGDVHRVFARITYAALCLLIRILTHESVSNTRRTYPCLCIERWSTPRDRSAFQQCAQISPFTNHGEKEGAADSDSARNKMLAFECAPCVPWGTKFLRFFLFPVLLAWREPILVVISLVSPRKPVSSIHRTWVRLT